MRADMAKVLVERPRLGSRSGSEPGKGYQSRVRKLLDAGDSPPVREGIRRPYTTNRKHFNEHLGPLRRYIDSQVGRPWDKVYAEVCANIDRGNVVQKHILTHLFEYVVTDAILLDGVPCRGSGRQYGQPLADNYPFQLWYVCPRSGLLRRARFSGRRAAVRAYRQTLCGAKDRLPITVVRVNESLRCLQFQYGWELVTVAPLPGERSPHYLSAADVVLGKPLTEAQARQHYGAAVYAVARRRLRKKELKQYPIPIDLVR